MNRNFLLPLLAALGLSLGACQKQPTEAERNGRNRTPGRSSVWRPNGRPRRRKSWPIARPNSMHANRRSPRRKISPRSHRRAGRDRHALDPRGRDRAIPRTPPTPPFIANSTPTATGWRRAITATSSSRARPHKSRDWRPYTNGRWVYTDAGWTWISDEQFGWATYHYGRWIRLRSVGWVWVPGEQWAPAWVSWRKGNDYVGWAPLPPEAQFDRQTGIRNWADNYYDIGPEQYAFVPTNEFGRQLTPREIVPTERNVTIINQTTNVTNITYNNSRIVDRGPSYDELRARSRQPIERLASRANAGFQRRKPGLSWRSRRAANGRLSSSGTRGAAKSRDPQHCTAGGGKRLDREFKMRKPRKKRAPRWKRKRPRHRICLQSDSLGRIKKTPMLPRPTPPTPGRIVSPAVSAATAIPVGTRAPLPSNPPPPPPTARPVVTPGSRPKRVGRAPDHSLLQKRSVRRSRPGRAQRKRLFRPRRRSKRNRGRSRCSTRPNASRKCCNAAAKNRSNPALRRLPRPHLSGPPQAPLLPFQKRRVPPRPTRRHPIKDQNRKNSRNRTKSQGRSQTQPFRLPRAKPTLTKSTPHMFLPVLARPGMKSREMPNESRSPTSEHRRACRSRPASCRAGSP